MKFVIAREYGCAGWEDLIAEVNKRTGTGLEWAVAQARQAIHDNDIEQLKRLLAEYPALLTWRGDPSGNGSVLEFATESYGDSFDPNSEEHFTRAACAELLIDAGAIVTPSVCEGLLRSRARGLLQLFHRKGRLPRTLSYHAALGDDAAVRLALDDKDTDTAGVTTAFTVACDFESASIASLLLDRAIELDPELGRHIDAGVGRAAFVRYFIDKRPSRAAEVGLWKACVMEQLSRAVYSWSGAETSFKSRRGQSDLTTFVQLLDREPWLIGEAFVDFQREIIERATLIGRGEFIVALLDRDPAIIRRDPPPRSQAIEFAFTYAQTHVVPLLARVWRVPDDLPHAAGLGDLARVKQWFDESGAPALGDVDHYPDSPYMPKDRVDEYARQWAEPGAQRVLDAALAWSVMNNHFEVADFLLDHGADINTRWSSHEPASLLHELVWHRNYDAMQFLIDRGIDMTIRDHRWHGTARGWAQYAAEDPALAQWLEEKERHRGSTQP